MDLVKLVDVFVLVWASVNSSKAYINCATTIQLCSLDFVCKVMSSVSGRVMTSEFNVRSIPAEEDKRQRIEAANDSSEDIRDV